MRHHLFVAAIFLTPILLLRTIAAAQSPWVIGVATGDLKAELIGSGLDQEGFSVLELENAAMCLAEIDQRALALRDAKCFLYSSKDETFVGSMYRERLIAHGVPVIDVHSVITPSKAKNGWSAHIGSLVASHLEN